MAGSVAELLQVDPSARELSWLEKALQGALKLEFATIPLYLAAQWSIKDPTPPANSAFGLLHGIALEEMLHLGLVCNMLTTLGASPDIVGAVPSYPSHGLPGGVRPDLDVTLAGLTKDRIAHLFMQIEYPEYHVPGTKRPPKPPAGDYATIGGLYDAIEATFNKLDPTVTGDRQLTATIDTSEGAEPLFKITNSKTFVKAIRTIKEQGEGTSQGHPDAPDYGDELAHYFKFGSLHSGKLYVQASNGTWGYHGHAIQFPSVWHMMEVPAGGYPNPAHDVATKLADFNAGFSAVVHSLQAAWSSGAGKKLDNAITGMVALGTLAAPLYLITVPGTSQTYGPTFEFISPEAGAA